MKLAYNIILFSIVTTLLSGCFTGNNNNINYFSINYPKINSEKTDILSKDYKISVLPFSSNELYGMKMVFSQPPNDVLIDNSNCWAQKPSVLVTNYFALYLGTKIKSAGNNIKSYTLAGKILEFDGNLGSKKTNLTIQIDFKDNLGNIILNKIYTKQDKMTKLSASAFAQSMTNSLNSIATNFFNDIKNIK
jgi:hypothetical protein